MDTNVLRTFIAVCEYAGFSAAAEKLGYTQSTVSSQIRQLEKELDTVLFDRFYHRIELTPEGANVLKYARNMLETQNKMLSDLSTADRIEGTVRLAMSSSVCNRYFRKDFLRFRELYPGIRLIVTESGTAQMFDMLQKNEADLVFTLDEHIYDTDYIICAEHKEQVHFIAAADHPIHKKEKVSLADVCRESFVLTENHMSYRTLLTRALAARSLQIQPALEIGNPIQICEIVRDSRLLSFLPDFIAQEYIENGQLKTVDVKECRIEVWTQLLMHHNKWRSRALSAFVDFYTEIVDGAGAFEEEDKGSSEGK